MKKSFLFLLFLTVFGIAIGMAYSGPYLVNYHVPEGEKIPHPTVNVAYLLSLGIYTKEDYTWCEELYCPVGLYFDPTIRECTFDFTLDKD